MKMCTVPWEITNDSHLVDEYLANRGFNLLEDWTHEDDFYGNWVCTQEEERDRFGRYNNDKRVR